MSKEWPTIQLIVDGQQVDLPSSVMQMIVMRGRILLLLGAGLSHLSRPHANGNIICLDEHGNWLWEIEHKQPTYDEKPGGAFNSFQRMDLECTTPPRMIAWNGDHRIEVDLETGKWLKAEFTR